MRLTDPFFNEDKSLKLFKQSYRKPHPLAGTRNPNWYCKIKLGRGVPQQTFSTGTRNDTEAYRIANERLAELRARHATGRSVSLSKFGELSYGYLAQLRQDKRNSQCSNEKYELHDRVIQKQFFPIWRKKEVASISSKDIQNYFNKRSKDYAVHIKWIDGKPIETKTNRIISKSYLNKEGQVLRALFSLAMEKDIITTIPKIPHYATGRDNLREGLSLDEWEWLRDYLDKTYVTSMGNPQQVRARFYRQVFTNWVKLIVYTGLRSTEAFKLKWYDWETGTEDGIQIGWLTVRADEKGARKTKKSRRFKITQRVNELLAYQRAITDYKKRDDYIFTHPNSPNNAGQNIISFKKAFNEVMKRTGLLFDEKGKKRTPYILRHTHAHLMRQAGKPIDDIADDIGNLTTTAQRFYIGTNDGDRKGLPIDVET